YVTLEPCVMCVGALLHARVARLVYGAPDPKAGAVESLYHLLEDDRFNHRVMAQGGLLAGPSATLLRDFFQARRRGKRSGSAGIAGAEKQGEEE
ncbi:nucleoside deaminase, partial [Acidithiobacillus sp. MC2.1]